MPFSSRSGVGIKERVYLVLGVVFVSVFALQVLIFCRWFEGSKVLELNANLELARAVAKGFEIWVRGLQHDLLTTGTALTSNISEIDRNQLLQQLQESNPEARSFFWMNPEGRVIASSLHSHVGDDLSDRSYFKVIVQGKDNFVSELIVGKVTGKQVFFVSRGIRSYDGRLLGIIATSIEPESLDEPLGIVRSSRGAGVSLIDQKGMHVYRYPHTEYSWEQRNWLQRYPIIQEALEGKEATGRMMGIERPKWRVVAFVPIPTTGWVASCSRYEHEITGAIIKGLQPQIALILMLTITVLGVTAGLLRPITKSINRLHKHVVQFSTGEYNQIEQQGPRELRDFGNALNKMAMEVQSRERSLQLLNANLEAQVNERTLELYASNQALEHRTQQLRRLAGKLTTTEQRERKYLGKIFHDGIQQYLVAAKLQLGSIAENYDSAIIQTIKSVDDLLGESIKVSRSLAEELSPPILHDGGILAALDWLSRWMANKHGLHVNIIAKSDLPNLEGDIKAFFFESVRELLLNSAHHAKTRSAEVTLSSVDGKLLQIAVSDQGVGFDPNTIGTNNNRFGLFSIRERIELLDGKVEIQSSPGNGSRIALTVPLGR